METESESLESYCRQLFSTASKCGPLTTPTQVLFRLLNAEYPDYEFFYDPEEFEVFLKARASQCEPLFILKDFSVMLFGIDYVSSPGRCPDERRIFLDSLVREAHWITALAIQTNPYALPNLRRTPTPAAERLLSAQWEPEPVTISPNEWEPFLKAVTASIALRWLFIVRRIEGGQVNVIDVVGDCECPIEATYVIHGHPWHLATEGIYLYARAETLARQALAATWPVEGVAGKLLILHCTEPGRAPSARSLNTLKLAKRLVKDSSVGSLKDALWRKCLTGPQRAKWVREGMTPLLREMGLSPAKIGHIWLKEGLITPWSDGNDAENAKRQVNTLLSRLKVNKKQDSS